MWQEFYTKHGDQGIEVVTVAMDAQGADRARPYVEEAGAAYTTLVDEDNLLSRLFDFKAVPNALLIDEAGLLEYQKYGGFDIRKQEYADIAEGWAQGASPQWLADRMQEDPRGGPNHREAIEHFQRGVDLYKEGDTAGALSAWKTGRDLEPDNWVIRKQIWAVEHPEKFYQGEVDYGWQREQIEQGV